MIADRTTARRWPGAWLALAPALAAGLWASLSIDARLVVPTAQELAAPRLVVSARAPRPADPPVFRDLAPVADPSPRTPPPPRRPNPIRVAVTPDGRKAYVALHGSEADPGREVAVVDVPGARLLARVRVGSRPKSVAMHPGGRFAVVTNWFSNYLSVIDTVTDRVTARVSVPDYCQQVEFAPDGRTAYVTCFWTGQVLVLDVQCADGAFAARVRPLGGFDRDAFFGPRGSVAPTGGVNGILRSSCGTSACHMRPQGGFVAGPDPDANLAAAVAHARAGDGAGSPLLRAVTSTTHGGVADALTGLHHPQGGVVFPDPRQDIDYQAIKEWIDRASEGPGIRVGDKPDAMALAPDGHTLFVANPFETSISVVDLTRMREVRRIYTQSVVTDLAVAGGFLVAVGLGAGFGAPKAHDPGGRESTDRDNPEAEFSLWRDPATGKPLPIARQKPLGPFAHVDGTAQVKFRDISNDIILIDLAQEARAPVENGWGLDVSRYAATPAYTRYASDTFEATFGDVKGDVPAALLAVLGAHPEQIVVEGDRLAVLAGGSFEIGEYRLVAGARDPAARLQALRSLGTGINPRGMAAVPGGRWYLTADFLDGTLSIIDRTDGSRRAVPVGPPTPRFPATDAERGELFAETSILSVDGDQSCVHCHYRDAGDGRAWSVSQTMGTNRAQTEERTGGSQRVPACVRNLAAQVPLFIEGTLSIDEPLTMIMEQNPLIDFAGPTPRGDYTALKCPPEREAEFAPGADRVVSAAPASGKALPPGTRVVDLAYRRDAHFRAITRRYWGAEYGIRDIQRFVGAFQGAQTRLLPNPLAQALVPDPEVELGRALFASPEVGCISCHAPPDFTLKSGIPNANAALPPLVSAYPRDDAHSLISAHRMDLNTGFRRDFSPGDRGRIEESEGFVTTPSLRGIWALPAIFLHHGQARSLREVVCTPDHPALRRHRVPPRAVTRPRLHEAGFNELGGLPDTHGQTSHLTARQVDALVRYLESIE